MGLNSICRVFKVSINIVQAWIKAEGKAFKQPNISEEKFVSCDEMWTFVQKKPTKHGYGSVSQKSLKRYWLYILEIEVNSQQKS